MPTKSRRFNPNLYYHIYNCGVEKRNVFTADRNYQRFLETIDFYLYDQRLSLAQFQKLDIKGKQNYAKLNPKGLEKLRVKLISYCLMPNHFHLLLSPAKENGVTQFTSDISNSYTRYFNIKNERVGNLFQGPFKSKEILSEESLLQVSRYIHLNPLISSKTNPKGLLTLEDYSFSSYKDWIIPLQPNPSGLELDYNAVSKFVKLAGGTEKYKKFVESKIGKNSKFGIENLALE